MRRLSVIDLYTGQQPISNETGTVQVVANGEIYRFERERERLEALGHVFKTKSDTEVLVHLYEEHGLDFLERIDGMFAFALWDAERGRLLVVRDRFGIKPLYYSLPVKKGHFAFGSEIRAVLKMPGLSMELDPVGVDNFFAHSYIPHPRTVYRQVKKLPPGCFLHAEDGQVDCIRYWDLPGNLTPLPEPDAISEVDAAIADAVGTMMRADVPVGAFLSGGLDSGTVVYHMAQCSARPIRTFAVRVREAEFDEGKEARETAEMLGTEHAEVWCRPEDVTAVLDLQGHFGEPFADPSQIPTFLVARAAREAVTVALSGDAGDELFGGYQTYCASLLANRLRYLPGALRKGLLDAVKYIPASNSHAGLEYKLRKFLSGCHLAPVQRHAMWRTIFATAERRALYNDEFMDLASDILETPLFNDWDVLFALVGDDSLKGYQKLDMKTYLTDNNLKKVDHMSMASSLEVRVPLLDLGVVQAAMRVPQKQLVNGLRTKTILRRMMKERLPRSVLKMRKKGFTIPLATWFQGALKDYVNEVLTYDRIESLGILRPTAVRSIVDTHLSGIRNNSRQIWNLIAFIHWHEQQAGN
jgi:asparagine synthase (glutamine-hydrolysing)